MQSNPNWSPQQFSIKYVLHNWRRLFDNLLRRNSHNIELIILEWTIQQHLVHSKYYANTTYSLFQNISIQNRIPYPLGASLVAQLVRNLPSMRETWVWSLVRKIPWRREGLPTPVFWPGELHGLYSPWGRKELDTTEGLSYPLSSFSHSSSSPAPWQPPIYFSL